VWLLILSVGVGAGLLVTYWFSRSRHTGEVHVEKPSRHTQDIRDLQLMAEARFIELATQVTFTRMIPTEQGWLLDIRIDSRVAKETDALDMLLELLDELQKTKVVIAQAGAQVYSNALRDQLGRRIPNLLIARMQVSRTTLYNAEWQHVKHEDMPKVLDELWTNQALKQEEQQG
jgi:hypothetical protein